LQHSAQPEPMTAAEYLQAVVPVESDERISYGSGPSQWMDVYRPPGQGPFPVVVLIHGGSWSTVASAETLSPNAAELAAGGVAVCNLEYRRVGEPGGGYPGLFLDLAQAIDGLKVHQGTFELDLDRVVVVGHSAGAHLAQWVGSRAKLPPKSPLFREDALRIRTVVAIAGIGDLRGHVAQINATCAAGISTLDEVIGLPSVVRPDPFADTSPVELLPTGTRTVTITGVYDDNWPPYLSTRWCRAARTAGDDADEMLVPDVGHFEVVDVRSSAWSWSAIPSWPRPSASGRVARPPDQPAPAWALAELALL
jgi:pimeloyl-ACP methyl ester carboxylesterase